MALAFQEFKEIDSLPDIHSKHKAWLQRYSGLMYAHGVEGHYTKGEEWTKQKYNPSKYDTSINLVARLPNETRIEFDGDSVKAKQYLENTAKKLESLGIGYIKSTHQGKSPYLWVQFNNSVTDKQAEAFISWIAPDGSQPDLNFASSNKVFPCLYGVHWKHSFYREMPVKYFEGNQIDFDSLNIKAVAGKKTTKHLKDFDYETFQKEPSYNSKPLELWQYRDFERMKEDKSFIVNKVIYPNTITLIYSPPGEFKSLLALYMGISIANGKEWLGFKSKKQAALYCDKENNDSTIKKRWKEIHSGMNLRRKNYPLYILRRNGNLFEGNFIRELRKVITEKEIRVIIFDTLHRFADYDENKSDDINRLYTEVFQPIKEELNCSIIAIHHTTKPDKNGKVVYRGSGDFLGMVDTAYLIVREKNNDRKTSKFRIVNEKSRAGEIENIFGEIDFGEGYIKFLRLDEEKEAEQKIKKLKGITERIKEFVQPGAQVKRKDIEDMFEMADIEFSTSTIKRSLKWLVDNRYFDYDDKKKIYWKVQQ